MDTSGIKKVLVLVVILGLAACDKEEEQIPVDILSQEEMISTLVDIRLAEGQVSSLSLSYDSTSALFKEIEKDIFEKHNVDSAVYRKSYQYYLLRPDLAIYITDAVIDSLKTRKDIKEIGRRRDR